MLVFSTCSVFIRHSDPLFRRFLARGPRVTGTPLGSRFVAFVAGHSVICRLKGMSRALFFIVYSVLVISVISGRNNFQTIAKCVHATGGEGLL